MPHATVEYRKPARTADDLLAHLRGRGLVIDDPDAARRAIEHIGYYRLLVYMRPLQRLPEKTFIPGTRFADVLALYDFDRELRLLCLDAVERIEVALRAAIINVLAVPLGPHFYLERRHFARADAFREFLQAATRASYAATEHYEERYNTPSLPPIWVVLEAVTYGTLSRLYSGLHLDHRKAVARAFGYDETVLVSWFRSVNGLRNKCAHHNRLWNSSMHVDQPKAAKRLSAELPRTDTFHARAVVLAALLGVVEPRSNWRGRLVGLLARYRELPLNVMGFPPGWTARPLWN